MQEIILEPKEKYSSIPEKKVRAATCYFSYFHVLKKIVLLKACFSLNEVGYINKKYILSIILIFSFLNIYIHTNMFQLKQNVLSLKDISIKNKMHIAEGNSFPLKLILCLEYPPSRVLQFF